MRDAERRAQDDLDKFKYFDLYDQVGLAYELTLEDTQLPDMLDAVKYWITRAQQLEARVKELTEKVGGVINNKPKGHPCEGLVVVCEEEYTAMMEVYAKIVERV
jgi:hypothetical protein